MILFLNTSEIFEIIKLISIVIASGVAIYGINSWRREYVWKGRYELAEQVLSLFYECSDVIKDMRRPLSFSGEGSSREKKEGESKKEQKIWDYANIPYERYKPYQEKFSTLQSLKYRFIAIFGKEHEEIFNGFFEILRDIFFYSNEIALIKLGEYGYRSASERGKEIKRIMPKVYSASRKDDDEVYLKLQSIIKRIEIVCRDIIKKS
jgi:hypothetical protein